MPERYVFVTYLQHLGNMVHFGAYFHNQKDAEAWNDEVQNGYFRDGVWKVAKLRKGVLDTPGHDRLRKE